MFKTLLITAFALFVSTNAQVAPQTATTTRANTTAPATNQTSTSNSSASSNWSTPANTTNGTRPQNTSANTTTSSQNSTSNLSASVNSTNGTRPQNSTTNSTSSASNQTSNWSTTANTTNGTRPQNTTTNTTSSASNQTSNWSTPANTTNGTRPQNTTANTTTSSQNQTSNWSTSANTTNGTRPMTQNTTGNWSAPANSTNGTKPMTQNSTGNWSAPTNTSNGTRPQNMTAPESKKVLANDPKPFTPYDQLVQQFNKTIQNSLDLFADDYSRAEIENMIYNNNATGYREQTHQQNAEDLLSALHDNDLHIHKQPGFTPLDVATTLNSSTILDDLKLAYDIGKIQANKSLAESGIYDTTDQIVTNQVVQNYTQEALGEIFAYLQNSGISPDVDNSVDMLKGQASKFTDSESTGDLLNKLLDTVATAASGPLYGVDQAIQQQSLSMGQKPSDIIGSFIEGMLNSGIARKGGRN